MKKTGFAILLIVSAFHWVVPALVAGTVSLETLLEEMTDRTRLARVPDPIYTCKQASSYDRDSVSPENQGSWYANWDRSQFVRVEQNQGRTEHVLMDVAGPGVVVRFWGTWHGPKDKPFSDGTLRFYLDSSPEPAIQGPITQIIDGGALAGPPLSEGVAPETAYGQRGHNLYLPIPYAKHCKITYETKAFIDTGAKKGEALYYQINYRTYEKGAQVQTFTMDQLRSLQGTVDRTQRRLMDGQLSGTTGLETEAFAGPIKPGESIGATLRGPAAIFELALVLQAEDREQALRSTVLEMAFDGEKSVWCPVGDFFGIGYKPARCQTWYTSVTADGLLRCYWVMPFAKACQITLRNLGSQTVQIKDGQARHGDWTWDDRSLHFHATWRQLTSVHTGDGDRRMENPDGPFDVNYVTITGQGTYVGDTLTILNGADTWWGEGDEKIFVDGESFPSHFGTGTEDYYGYAWCRPEYFARPFHAQPNGGGNLQGGFSVNSRYRLLDAIPFRQSLKFDMELWHWRPTRMNYAPSTFFYARPGVRCNIEPDPATAALAVGRSAKDLQGP